MKLLSHIVARIGLILPFRFSHERTDSRKNPTPTPLSESAYDGHPNADRSRPDD